MFIGLFVHPSICSQGISCVRISADMIE